MFGIPPGVFWPTASFGAIILLVFGAVVVLRYLPQPKSRMMNQRDAEALDDLHVRLDEFEQLQQRVNDLEERVDFAERLLAKQREAWSRTSRLPSSS